MYEIILLLAYAIDPLIFIDACNKFLLHEPEKKKRNSILGFSLLYSIVVIKEIFLYFKYSGQSMMIFLPLIVGSMFFITHLYKERENKKIIRIILALTMLSLIVDGTVAFFLKLLQINADVLFSINEINATVAMISKLVEAAIYCCIVNFLVIRRKINELYLIFLYLVAMIISLTLGSLFLSKIKGMMYFILGIEVTLIVLLGIYINYVIQYKSKSEEKAIKEMELMKQNQMLTNQAMGVRDELRSLRHDLRGHFDMIVELVDKENLPELKHYVDYIRKDMDSANALCMSDNMAISVVITKKMREAKEKGIKFEYVITTDTLPISLYEQTILLNNLLSNAIEACMQENVHKKFIDFLIKKGAYGETIIKCSNSMGVAPIRRNGIFLTTKSDKVRHGIGFKNIQKTVKKNYGKLQFWSSDEGDVFYIQITFSGGEGNGSINV